MRAARTIAVVFAAVTATGGAYWLWPTTPLPAGITAERLEIDKDARRLVLFAGGEAVKFYRISLGRVPAGAKEREGDGRTPEGRYIIDFRKTDSAYYRALHISYPNPYDRNRAKSLGVSPGGAIMIHGLPNGLGWIGRFHRFYDWTQGCIAVTNPEMDELWHTISPGMPVEIRP